MWAILATLIVYQVLLLAIGWWARSRSRSSEAYFIGERALGPYLGALSYAAGSSSAWSILGVSGIAFSQGFSSIWLLPGTLTGHLVVWFWLAPKLREMSHAQRWITLTDLLAFQLQDRAAAATYRISAVVILFSFTFYIAAQFQGAANTFGAVFQFDFATALLIGAGVVLLYTLWGGFWAVNLTDALQALLMLAACVLLPVVAWQAVGGWRGMSAAWTAAPTGYADWLGGHTGWFAVGLLIGLFSIGFGPLGQPHLLNRIMALARPEHIRLARRVAIGWFVAVLGGMFLLGLCGHVLVSASVDPEQVFFALARSLLPSALTGVLIAAVLSAIMSTADSQLLVAGAALHHDLGRAGGNRLLSPRVAVVGVALAAVALAMWLPETIFARVLFAWNALGAAFGPVVIARMLGWRFSGFHVPAAILLGFGATVLFYSLPDGPGDLWERAVPFLLATVTLWLGRSSDE